MYFLIQTKHLSLKMKRITRKEEKKKPSTQKYIKSINKCDSIDHG